MHFYFSYILTWATINYEEQYWRQCDLNDRYWAGLFKLIEQKVKK